jgi:hypothetical protein
MAALECKLPMVINRLVEFELLMEFKIEQKKGALLHTSRKKHATSLKQSVRGLSVCPSQLYISISAHTTSGN